MTTEADHSASAAIFCLFAKPPRAGTVKTRLIPAIGAEAAAALATALLRDTFAQLSQVEGAEVVIASTALEGIPIERATVWLQGDGDLGARLERVLRRALRDVPMVFAVGADSPGLSRERYERAIEALAHADAVLGPSEDGGFYLLGLRACPEGLLAELPWSVENTYAATRGRLWSRGLVVAELAPWFDIDRVEDFENAFERLHGQPALAPATIEWLGQWRRTRGTSDG
ncbi:MAG: TIGR04282 family arsenosugar biosynthesis glycosyltransferase [Myxococcales bacterium]|nr:TIGR04282 family arsenosugar biosynthesis glycosyltransferase [Myxococcales bacterium]